MTRKSSKKENQPIRAEKGDLIATPSKASDRMFMSDAQKDLITSMMASGITVTLRSGLRTLEDATKEQMLYFTIELANGDDMNLVPGMDGIGFYESLDLGCDWKRIQTLREVCVIYFASCFKYRDNIGKSIFEPKSFCSDYEGWLPLMLKFGLIKAVEKTIIEYETC